MFSKSHMLSNRTTFAIVFEVLISVYANKVPWRFIFNLLYKMSQKKIIQGNITKYEICQTESC